MNNAQLQFQKKSTIIWFTILVCLYLHSCKNYQKNQESEGTNVEIFPFSENDVKNVQWLNLSELYSDISGFPLDFKGGPIGHVSKVLIFEDILFAFDSHYAKKIFAYDLKNKGKFLYSIGNQGKGPGEFVRLADFAIDSLNRQILAADPAQRRLSWFDLDGNFLQSKTLDFSPVRVYCNEEFIYSHKLVDKKSESGVIVLDKMLNSVAEYLPFSKFPTLANFDTGFQKIGNKLLLNYPSCDTIFQFKGSEIFPYMAINTGKYSFYSCVKRNNLKHSMDISKFFSGASYLPNPLYKDVLFPFIYFEDDKLKVFQFDFNQKKYEFIKNKVHNNPPIIRTLYNDFFQSHILLAGYDKRYGTIGIIISENMRNADVNMAKEKKQLISEELMHCILNSDPNSNPVVVFLK